MLSLKFLYICCSALLAIRYCDCFKIMNTWNINKFQSTYHHIKPLDKISSTTTSSTSRLFLADSNYSNNQSNLPLNIKNNHDLNNNNDVNDSSSTTCIVSTKSHINSFNPTELLSKKWILSLMIFFISTLALHLPSVLASTGSVGGSGGIDSIITTISSSISRFGSSSSSSGAATDVSTLDLTDNSNGGFIQSFLIIFISEIGDKTFFIAGLLAAKYGRLLSFSGSISALAIMTIISTVLGQIFHAIPSSITQGIPYDDYIAIIAFTYFGIKTLYDANQLQDGKSSGIDEERAEAEEVVSELTSSVATNDNRNNTIALFIQIFSLVFAAEIGKLTLSI